MVAKPYAFVPAKIFPFKFVKGGEEAILFGKEIPEFLKERKSYCRRQLDIYIGQWFTQYNKSRKLLFWSIINFFILQIITS